MNRILSILGILIFLISCKATGIKNSSEFKMKDESVNLFAFIGEKISVIEFDPNENNTEILVDTVFGEVFKSTPYIMDYGFKCKYRVLKNVFNQLETDTIEFVAYDHYGHPGFEKYKNAIIYISLNKEGEKYYHQKYQYDPVEKKNGICKGLNGESVEELFNKKKQGVLIARKLFEE